MYKLNQVKLNINHSDNDFKAKIAKLVKVSVDDIEWSTLIILHKSIDARDKSNIQFVYNVAFDFVTSKLQTVGDDILSSRVGASLRALEKYEPVKFNPYIVGDDILSSYVGAKACRALTVGADSQLVGASYASPNVPRPVVVGFGPAGIFASYIFALNGLKPIIIERGKSLEDRTKDVEKFFKTMELDEESNVCFGEGGAGAFSDGKLNTNNKDKTGIYHFILETFVKFGADERILYENMPHIGTDKLVDVIKNIRDEIVRLGGEIHYSTKWKYEAGSHSSPVILAIGNSSRDTFRDLIENGFDLKAKPFAIGYRIAHKQLMIDDAQYGRGSQILGPATYKLTYDVGNGHSVYSFCMCPGGYIINSSNFKNMLSINGMSYNDRSGKYANSAIVETISPEDVLGSHNLPLQDKSNTQGTTGCRPLQEGAATQITRSRELCERQVESSKDMALRMIEFQELIEKRAFELEKGFIPYVTSEGSDICPEEVFKGQAKYSEKLKTVFDDLGLKFDINDDIEKALQHFNKIIPGFFSGSHSSPLQKGSHSSHLQGTTECRPLQSELGKDRTTECRPLHDEPPTPQYIIAGVETRTSSPVKLDRDENYMCNVPNYYPCGEGLSHGGGIISCAADGVKVAMKIIETRYI